ncbi:MAG: ABC transporter permease [Anaerolineae bacterium]|nr:ABC transporter permease [Anaerolineae bacterium]
MIRKIFSIVKADFLLEFAYPISWVFFLGLPVLFTIIIGVALGGSQAPQPSDVDTRPSILVIDLDQTVSSGLLLESIIKDDTVRLVTVNSIGQAEFEQEQNNHPAILTIPEGFETALQENKTLALPLRLGESSYTTIAIENSLQSALQQSTAVWKVARGSLVILGERKDLTETEAQAALETALTDAQEILKNPLFSVEINQDPVSSPEPVDIMNGFNQSSAGQLVTWTMITLLGGSIIFAMERENGTYQRMMTTPTSRFTYFIGKLLSRLLMSLVQMVILVLFGSFILKVDWGDSPLLLLVFLACFGFAGTALGLMLGSLVKTAKQADALTTILSMMMASLGGAWWPLEITPPIYQSVVRVLPTTWAMMGFNDIIIKGQGLEGILLEIAVLIGFGLLFCAVGIFRMRNNTN